MQVLPSISGCRLGIQGLVTSNLVGFEFSPTTALGFGGAVSVFALHHEPVARRSLLLKSFNEVCRYV